jgi:hypothetical protein
MRTISLALLLAAAVRALPAQTLPTAPEIVARHEAAMGGRAALDKHSSIRMLGTVEIADADLKGTIEILRAKPNRFVQKMTFSRIGTLVKGFDSTAAWVLEPGGPALLTGADAEMLADQAAWYHEFLVHPGLLLARVDSSEFQGERAWKLTYATDLGLEVNAFFSRESSLRLGESWTTPEGETVLLAADYKEFGGVKLPTTLTNRTPAGTIVITITSVEFDKVDRAALAVPPEVKVLIGSGKRGG